MKYIIFMLMCLVVHGFGYELKCNEEEKRRIDTYVSRILVVNEPNRKFVGSPAELRAYCTETTRYLYYIETYAKKCLNEFGKNAASVLIYPIKNQYKAFCKPGKTPKKALELMKAATCANAAKPSLQQCFVQMIDASDGIAYQAPDKLKIPMCCCNYYKFMECIRTETEEYKQCTRATLDYVFRWMDDIFSGIMNFLCTNYEEGSDKCDKLIQQTPKSFNTTRRMKSFIIPAIDIISNIKDEV